MWLGPAVEPRAPLAGLEIDVPAELGCDHDLVAERRDAFAEDPLHLMRPVRLGRVEEGDATVEGRPDDVDHLGPAGDRRLIGAAHVLNAEADAGDLQRAELSPPARLAAGLLPAAGRLRRGGRPVAPSSDAAARLPAAPRKPRRPITVVVPVSL